MTPDEAGKADLPKDWERDLPSWRRIGEFIRNILRLERSVEALKKGKQGIGAARRYTAKTS